MVSSYCCSFYGAANPFSSLVTSSGSFIGDLVVRPMDDCEHPLLNLPGKLQRFCKAKDTINKTKRPPTDWERIFTNTKSDRGLISNIYKELKKLNSRNSKNPIKNGVQS